MLPRQSTNNVDLAVGGGVKAHRSDHIAIAMSILLRYSGEAYYFAKPWATVVDAAAPAVEVWTAVTVYHSVMAAVMPTAKQQNVR